MSFASGYAISVNTQASVVDPSAIAATFFVRQKSAVKIPSSPELKKKSAYGSNQWAFVDCRPGLVLSVPGDG